MEFLRAKGQNLLAGDKKVLLRGFGLGGWFLPEGYMWKLYNKCDRPRKMEAMIERLCGLDYADAFWKRYLDDYITEEDIRMIALEGFNSVRLPINARHLYREENHILVIIPEMIARIDQLIDWCRRYHIYVVLDMHGAPGGQTGQNIDDSEADLPALFMEQKHEEELIFLWRELAIRYCEEPIVAGYDLLNEPLPNWFSQYNHQVLPLYRRLIETIREHDKNHVIILEGVHWATEFSVFEDFTKEEAAANIMLQFHKYWNNPDYESMEGVISLARKFNVPLFLGESGENNCDWYTTIFPLCEQHNISWSFWSYKKMECSNSPVTFDIPSGWKELMDDIDGTKDLTKEKAIIIFNQLLQNIRNFRINKAVLQSLKRKAPVKIPCEAYNKYLIQSERIPGAKLRITDPVSLLFENGKIDEVDYRRYGGEEQPEEENIVVKIHAGDSLGYCFNSQHKNLEISISADGEGILKVSVNQEEGNIAVHSKGDYRLVLSSEVHQEQYLWLTCITGEIRLDNIFLSS
jgi:endoglucanase